MAGADLLTAKRSWLIANLLGQIAFGLLAMTLCLPSMQEWGAIFQADQAAVQLTFSAFVVAYGGLQLVYGPLSDRLGRKPILLFGLALAAAGSLMAALAPGLASLTAARFVQGAGAAATMVVGRAMVQDLFAGAERTRLMAYIGMVLGLCPPLATVVGGQLHVRLGWQSNFVLMTVVSVLMFLAAWRGLPARAPTLADGDGHWLRALGQSYARLLREPAFLLYITILSMSTATFYCFLAGAPIVLRSYGIGPAGVGWYIMCVPMAYFVGNYLTSRWVQARGERHVMRIGQGFALAGLVLLLVLGLAGLRTPLAFSLPLLLLGLGHGLLVPPSISGTVGLIPALAGTAAAAAGLVQQLMGAVGGYTVGLVSHDGSVNLGLLMLGFTLGALAAQVVLHRR